MGILIREDAGERRVIEYSGVLDTRAAEQLASAASSQPGWLPVVFDLSHAVSVADAALARLAEAIKPPRQAVFRGLARHQERLLAYLGAVIEQPPAQQAT